MSLEKVLKSGSLNVIFTSVDTQWFMLYGFMLSEIGF